MIAFLEALDLRDITLLCQDWGGLIGLRLVAGDAAALRAGDGGQHLPADRRFERSPEAFLAVARVLSQGADVPGRRRSSSRGCTTPLSPAVHAAYDAPFPDERTRPARAQFPRAGAGHAR